MNSTLHIRHRARRGSALAVTFWLIAIMGLVVLGSLQFAIVDTRTVTAHRGLAQARRMAERGLAIGSHPAVRRGDPLLAQEWEAEAFVTVVTSEDGRVNPNALIGSQQSLVLTRLFLHWGMVPAQASALTGAMTDWVDGDDFVSLHGAESKAYAAAGRPGLPLNRPFLSLEEIRMVMGMDALEALQPQWRDAFTIWTEGRIDLNEASPEVMAAATGARLEAARRVCQTLAGRDGIRYTADDIRFVTVEEALQRLGIVRPPAPHLGVVSQLRRVEAVGQASGFQTKIMMVWNGTVPLHRQELPVSTPVALHLK